MSYLFQVNFYLFIISLVASFVLVCRWPNSKEKKLLCAFLISGFLGSVLFRIANILRGPGQSIMIGIGLIGYFANSALLFIFVFVLRKTFTSPSFFTIRDKSISKKTADSASPEDKALAGIGGWLMLPAVGLALSLVLSLFTLIRGFALMAQDYFLYTIPSGLVNVGLYVYLWIVAIKFFKKRKNAPRIFIRFIIARVVASVILFIMGVVVFGGGEELIILMLLRANNFIAQGIAAAVWIPYFRSSRRVKATFVN